MSAKGSQNYLCRDDQRKIQDFCSIRHLSNPALGGCRCIQSFGAKAADAVLAVLVYELHSSGGFHCFQNILHRTSNMLLILVFAVVAYAKYIVPGARWCDTDGNLVNAHAGGVTIDKDTGKFWWFGEYKVQGQEEGGGVSVYSSNDLATWEHHDFALGMYRLHLNTIKTLCSLEPIERHPYIDPISIIQRPKVVFSKATNEYHVRHFPFLLLRGLR